MKSHFKTRVWTIRTVAMPCGFLGLMLTLAGCQSSVAPEPVATTADDTVTAAVPEPEEAAAPTTSDASQIPAEKKRVYAPVQLGAGNSVPSKTTTAEAADVAAEPVLHELQPLQVLLGKWSGNARKAAQLHQQEWVWDFRSEPAQPALVLSASQSPYVREARLTYDTTGQEFLLTLTPPEGAVRVLRGTFSQPVEDVAGDDKKLQRTFKLDLTEAAATDGELWKVSLHQLENNRFLIELDRKRGSGAFQRVDTVHSQREGTSFALSDSDYGERTCIISQGLGTISVSYQGKSFWVCCTGCQAAFNDDPAKWIAKWEAREKSMKN